MPPAEQIKEDRMSRNRTRKMSLHGQHRPSHVVPALSVQDLEERWTFLRLQAKTKEHLEDILKAHGPDLALAATIALSLEVEVKREEPKMIRSVWEWMIEELRLLFLEEGCAHLVESSRLIVDAFLAWTLVQGSVLIIRLALSLMVLGVLFLSSFLIRKLREHLASGHRSRV